MNLSFEEDSDGGVKYVVMTIKHPALDYLPGTDFTNAGGIEPIAFIYDENGFAATLKFTYVTDDDNELLIGTGTASFSMD